MNEWYTETCKRWNFWKRGDIMQTIVMRQRDSASRAQQDPLSKPLSTIKKLERKEEESLCVLRNCKNH